MAMAIAAPSSQHEAAFAIDGPSELEDPTFVPLACEDDPLVPGLTVTEWVALLDGCSVAPSAVLVPPFFA